ncbi:hypothetical protein [Breoghania sp.]|uniref:hypothetical protein n=1 Tax=Breoghania sp. TaxID=2065378 RepID=UPI002602F586|nr:hypothetical protein [Breoghania sp.]MDJ0931078.1 hypothetical protein [Breoghania sp.]
MRYTTQWLEAHAEIRHGFNGHHGIVDEVGVDAIAHPSDRLTVKFGPHLAFVDSD